MTKIGIVYDEQSGEVRWIMVPEKDSDLDSIVLYPGEAAISVDKLDFKQGTPDTFEALSAVAEFQGKPMPVEELQWQ